MRSWSPKATRVAFKKIKEKSFDGQWMQMASFGCPLCYDKLFLTPVPSQQRSRSHDLTCTSMTNIFTAKTSHSSFFGSRGVCFNDLTGTVIETGPQQYQKTHCKKLSQNGNSKKTFTSPWLKKCVVFTEWNSCKYSIAQHHHKRELSSQFYDIDCFW